MAGTAPTGQTTSLIRVAGSTRPFLLGWRWYFGPALVVAALELVGLFEVPTPFGLVLWFVPVYWLFNRSQAVWIEREDSTVRVRSRRVGDFSSHMLRLRPARRGDVRAEYPPDTPVRYDDSGVWWRADRGLFVGDDRFAIYPEGRKMARTIASHDQRH